MTWSIVIVAATAWAALRAPQRPELANLCAAHASHKHPKISLCAQPEASESVSDARRTSLDLPPGAVALDCEMVKVRSGRKGERFALGQCCIIDAATELVLFDQIIRPEGEVVDYLTRYSGLTEVLLRAAMPFSEAREEIVALLQNRTIIGHGLESDFKVLGFWPEPALIADTALLEWGSRLSRKLRDLVRDELGMEVQTGAHSAREDARAALRLYAHWLRIGERAAAEPRVLHVRLIGLGALDAPELESVLRDVPLPPKVRRVDEADVLSEAEAEAASTRAEAELPVFSLEWSRQGVRQAIEFLLALEDAGAPGAEFVLPASLHKDTRRRLHTLARAAGGSSISVGTGSARHLRLQARESGGSHGSLHAALSAEAKGRQRQQLARSRPSASASSRRARVPSADAASSVDSSALRTHLAFARALFDACGRSGGALCRFSVNELVEMGIEGRFDPALEALMAEEGMQSPPPPMGELTANAPG